MRTLCALIMFFVLYAPALASDWVVRPFGGSCPADVGECSSRIYYFNQKTGEIFMCHGVEEMTAPRKFPHTSLSVACYTRGPADKKLDIDIYPAASNLDTENGWHLYWMTGPNRDDLRLCEVWDLPNVCSKAPVFNP
jgi:hypothetical protein